MKQGFSTHLLFEFISLPIFSKQVNAAKWMTQDFHMLFPLMYLTSN
jgi:hypothetical protein